MNDISLLPSIERVTGMERRKRRISEEETYGAPLDQKRPRVSVFFRLESESSLDSQDDTESVYSIQDRETDVARDTSCTEDSDLETGSGSELELESGAELVTLEYDVASLSSDGDDFPDYTSSGTEDLNIQAAAEGAFAAVLLDTSLEPWETDGDTSEGSTIFDAFDFVECRRDFWTCLQCKLHNDNPAYRYCDKCFQKCWQCKTMETFRGFSLCVGCYKVRKTFFPPRPRPSRKRKHHDESSAQQRVKLDTLKGYLKDLKDNAGAAQDLDASTSAQIPHLNFEDIVVPQQHLQRLPSESGGGASARTHDARAHSGSDSDIFDDGAAAPRKKRCKIDRAAASDASSSSHSEADASKHSLANSSAEPECASQDSGIAKSSCSQELTDSQPESQASGACGRDGAGMLLNASNLRRHTDEAQHSDSKPESDSGVSSRHTFDAGEYAQRDAEMCIMCTSAPKNGIFLHGSIGHMCCCYKCAMRVWRNSKRCPVCNCKVKNVVKLFTS